MLLRFLIFFCTSSLVVFAHSANNLKPVLRLPEKRKPAQSAELHDVPVVAMPAVAANSNLKLIDFIFAGAEQVEKQVFQPRLQITKEQGRNLVKAGEAENHWQISSRASNSDINKSFTQLNEKSLKTELSYLTAGGFGASVFSDIFSSSDYVASDRSTVSSLGLTLSQELVKSGARSLEVQRRLFDSVDSKLSLNSAEKTNWTEKLNLYSELGAYFDAKCWASSVRVLNEKIKKTIRYANIQYEARVINSRDYLRFKGLSLYMDQRIHDADSSVEILEKNFLRFGAEFQEFLKKSASGFDCMSMLGEGPSVPIPKKDTILSRLSDHPFVIEYDLYKRRSDIELERVGLSELPSVSLYGVTSNNQRNIDSSYANNVVGLNISYIFPGDWFSAEKSKIRSDKLLNEFNKQRLQKRMLASVEGLYAQISGQVKKNDDLKNQHENLKQLVNLIETQQEIGMIDVTSSIDTLIKYIENEDSLRMNWLVTSLKSLELQLYNSTIK